MQEINIQKKKYKTTHILGIVFLVLVGLALLSGSLFGDKEIKEGALYKLKADKITKIEIIRGGREAGETIVLNKEADGIWTVEDGVNADMEYVQAILNDLSELKVKKETVSENSEKQIIYEVDEMGMEVLVYYNDNVKADFYIGKFGPNFNSNYIRKKDSDNVYLTIDRIGSNFGKPSFKEMAMLRFNPGEAERLRVKTSEIDWEIWKDGDDWMAFSFDSKMSSVKVLDKFKVKDFLILLSGFRGQDIVNVDEDEDTGFDKPPLEITATLAGGAQKVLTVGLGYPKVATYYAKSSDGDKVYIVSQWQRDELMKSSEDFE